MTFGRTTDQIVNAYKEAIRRIQELPDVSGVAVGTVVPWREGENSFAMQFSTEGRVRGTGEEDPRARFRTISPGFFATLGAPILAGRDFNDADRRGSEPVVIVSQSLAERMFPNQDAVNRHLMWTDPVLKFINISDGPRRIVGVVADIEDEKVTPGPAVAVYHPLGQAFVGQRAFIHTRGDPYLLLSPVTNILRAMAPDQVVERAASLENIRAEILAPDRLNAIVFGGFAAVALAIAVVGVAGVLAFSVSGRTREFGIRLALGSQPRSLLMDVVGQGAVMAAIGIVAGRAPASRCQLFRTRATPGRGAGRRFRRAFAGLGAHCVDSSRCARRTCGRHADAQGGITILRLPVAPFVAIVRVADHPPGTCLSSHNPTYVPHDSTSADRASWTCPHF